MKRNKIFYKAGYKYQLNQMAVFNTALFPKADVLSKFIRLTKSGELTIFKGYAWDGPSGPTIDTKSFMRGSLAHDALYQLMREKRLTVENARELADKVLRDVCIQDGMWKVRAWWVYRAVRIGAKQSSVHGRKLEQAP